MGYEMRLIEEESTLLTIFDSDFSIAADTPKLLSDMKDILDRVTSPVFMLDELSGVRVSFSDAVSALALTSRGEMAVTQHPNIRKVVIVSTNEMVRLGGKALRQVQYGAMRVDIYSTLEEAQAEIRKEIASGQA